MPPYPLPVISNVTKPPISLVKLAHSLITNKVKSGDIAIDATVGNGHDTQFLLELVSAKGKVFGFDIQQAAIESALAIDFTCSNSSPEEATALTPLTLIQASHAKMGDYIPSSYHGKISAVMFNLGYLPGGDKRIITQADSTLVALSCACQLLSASGIITVLAYPNHEGGEVETEQVKNWCLNLDPGQYQAKQFENHPENPSAPKLFVVSKIR
jgi:Putative rRNA methylase